MQTWAKRIQKNIDTNVRFLVWCGCIASMGAIMLKNIFSESKSTEEPQPPKDYAEIRWTDSDWVKWIHDNKDNWN